MKEILTTTLREIEGFINLNMNTGFLVTAVLILVAAFILGLILGKFSQKLLDKSMIEGHRKDAVKKSRAVIGGQVAEQLAPFLPGFPCNPGDVCFIGKPVDFLAFPGMSEGKAIEEVLLIEVKTGQSKLNSHERQIRNAIKEGRVRYIEYNPDL